MNGVIVSLTEKRPTPGLPPVVAREIMAFLSSGNTGKIILNIKDGRVLTWDVHRSGRVGDLDRPCNGEHDLDR